MEPYIPTIEEIESSTHNRKNLARWGISWPPYKGWKQELIRKARLMAQPEHIRMRSALMEKVTQAHARYERHIRRTFVAHHAEQCRAQGWVLRDGWLETGLDTLGHLRHTMDQAQVSEDEESAFIAEYLLAVLVYRTGAANE